MTMIGLILAAVGFSYANMDPVPEAPTPAEWTFRAELAEPAAYHAKEAYRIVDGYGLGGETETVRADLERFMVSAGKPATKVLTLRKGEVDGYESYRVEVAANGDVTLTANDDDGIRRAACYFEDRVQAGDLAPTVRKPWLRNRISRCFFGPIKRPPFNRDELMDDIDYYPDEYLNRLAHEGINGLWLTIELRNIVKTSFNARDKDAPRRIAKLRRTVEKCRRYGIRTWIFCIEPRRIEDGDPLLAKFPAEALSAAPWGMGKVLCPASPLVRQYIEESFRDLFEQVPGLPGVLNISHGERPTTCLSSISAVDGKRGPCPGCAKLEPWQIHWNTAESVVKGMRAVNPKAEFISWFYQPYVEHERASWVSDVARHLPEGVTMIYNFESGAIKNQLGRYRPGGDYWLSYVGPSPAFEKVASASREANGLIGAKIQVGCSHECATVPFVPVPGLLYRKYAAMKAARCSTVMQCWYFGNYPGIMNKAAGELAFSDLTESEDAFLLKLAKPEWGEDAATVAKMWRDFSDAYANYPLSNDMQYYGPFHAGVAWPLLPGVEMRRLGRTWKPQDAPSGDAIGECLENHTLEEASILADRMRTGSEAKDKDGKDVLAALEAKYAGDGDRLRDLGVIKALKLLFASGSDILEFYRLRETAISASRYEGDSKKALTAVAGMRACILGEKDVTAAMLPLAQGDSRLGFHSEAEAHQFHAKKLAWRMKQLDGALAELDRIADVLRAGGTYPLSAWEREAPQIRVGEKVSAGGFSVTVRYLENGDFEIAGSAPRTETVVVHLHNVCATAWPQELTLKPDGYATPHSNVVAPQAVVKDYVTSGTAAGWTFRVVLDARSWACRTVRRPGWIHFACNGRPVFPAKGLKEDYRLNIGSITPENYARIVDDPPPKADWMSGRYGVMVHWLYPTSGEAVDGKLMGENAFGHSSRYIDEPVDAFDLDGFLADVDRSGAQWVIFTVGQNRGAWASPNSVIDRRIGPGHCSRRDLVLELGKALHARRKRLIAYLPLDCMHPTLQKPFGWIPAESPEWTPERYDRAEYQRRWAEVIREWSIRWGGFCDGWFFDGTHQGRFPTGVDGELIKAAATAGNPASVVSFNFGVPVATEDGSLPRGLGCYAGSDYLACEIGAIVGSKVRLNKTKKGPDEFWMPKAKCVEGTACVHHSLLPIDGFWGGFNPYPKPGGWLRTDFADSRPEMFDQASLDGMRQRGEWPAPVYSEESLGRYVRDFTSVGGGVTLNVGIDEKGRLNPKSVDLLSTLRTSLPLNRQR